MHPNHDYNSNHYQNYPRWLHVEVVLHENKSVGWKISLVRG